MTRTQNKHTALKLLATATAGLAALGICGAIVYNKLIESETNARNAFAAIDSELRQRAAVLPVLVSELQNCTALQAIAVQLADANDRLLAATGVAEVVRADAEIAKALETLVLTVDEGAELVGCDPTALQALREQLTSSEPAIAAARKRYNEAAIAYNRLLRRFPDSVLARLCNFEKYSVFTALPQA